MLAQSEDDKPKRAENITEKAVRVQVPFAILSVIRLRAKGSDKKTGKRFKWREYAPPYGFPLYRVMASRSSKKGLLHGTATLSFGL